MHIAQSILVMAFFVIEQIFVTYITRNGGYIMIKKRHYILLRKLGSFCYQALPGLRSYAAARNPYSLLSLAYAFIQLSGGVSEALPFGSGQNFFCRRSYLHPLDKMQIRSKKILRSTNRHVTFMGIHPHWRKYKKSTLFSRHLKIYIQKFCFSSFFYCI